MQRSQNCIRGWETVVLEKAMEIDVLKDIVECNIKRASEKGQEAFFEKIYEVAGVEDVIKPPVYKDDIDEDKATPVASTPNQFQNT